MTLLSRKSVGIFFLDPLRGQKYTDNGLRILSCLAVARERHLEARRWHKHWAVNKTKRHADYVLKRLEADVFPEFGRLPG